MLVVYADDARLYVPLARLDLIQKYQSLGGVKPTLDRLGTAIWESRKTRVRKSVDDMSESFSPSTPNAGPPLATLFHPTPIGNANSKMAFEFEETPTSFAPLMTRSAIWNPRSRWTACSAVTSVTGRQKSRCAPPSRP